MELVLLRHAKAEKQSPGLPDETRNLTTKGFKTARAVAKGLSRYWAAGAKIEIWAGNLQRQPGRINRRVASIQGRYYSYRRP